MLYIYWLALICFFATASQASQKASPPTPPVSKGKIVCDDDTINLVIDLVKSMKADKSNDSWDDMISDRVMKEHTLISHKPNKPFFYSNDKYVITDIINLVLEDPDGVFDETKSSGILKIYRECHFQTEIEMLFDREQRSVKKFQDPKHDFQKGYLGQVVFGPTNRVIVVLKIKGDEQNASTLKERLTYLRNNIQFVDAYPVKDQPLKPVPVAKKVNSTGCVASNKDCACH